MKVLVQKKKNRPISSWITDHSFCFFLLFLNRLSYSALLDLELKMNWCRLWKHHTKGKCDFRVLFIQEVDFFFQIWISANVLAAVFTFCWLKATRFSIYFELSLNQDQSQLSSSIRSEVTYENRRIGQNADIIKKIFLQINILQHFVHISC